VPQSNAGRQHVSLWRLTTRHAVAKSGEVDALVEKLSRLGLIRTAEERQPKSLASAERRSLAALCNAGVLEGGLSVALDVRPDELIGPLAIAIGNAGLELKVIDTRDEPRPEITVRLRSLEKTWTVVNLEALVTHLNELFQAEPAAKAVAILGEHEDALQLWAVDKALLGELLGNDFFRPRNRKQLTRLAQAHTSC
jgi:hypothetical protein